jgi:PKD repeat protein
VIEKHVGYVKVDGNSVGAMPSYTFTNVQSNHTIVASFSIIPAPVADFTGSPMSGKKPLTVNFSDQSTGNVSSRTWSFGDSGTSTEQNPSHTYSNPGTYTVSLSVNGPGGSDTENKPDYITVEVSDIPVIRGLLLDD